MKIFDALSGRSPENSIEHEQPIGEAIAHNSLVDLRSSMELFDKVEALIELDDRLSELRDISIDPNKLADCVDDEYWSHYEIEQRRRLMIYKNTVATGRVLIHDKEDEVVALFIPASEKQKFCTVADQVGVELESMEVDKSEEHNLSLELVVFAQNLLADSLESQMSGVLQLLPRPEPVEKTPTRFSIHDKITQFVLRKLIEVNREEQTEAKISELPVNKIARRTRKVIEWIDDFLQDPEKNMASILVQSQLEIVKQAARDEVEELLASRNDDLVKSMPTSVKEHVRHAEVESKRAKKRAQRIKPTMEEATSLDESINEVEISEIGEAIMKMPWLDDDSRPRTVFKLSYMGNYTFITYGLSPQLESIAQVARDKATSRSDGINGYDVIVEHMAKRIAGGVLPHQSANSVKPVRKVLSSSSYNCVPLWYSFERSNNAPRVYFTVKKMGELLDVKSAKFGDMKEDDLCVVVLAETDKANQVDVLKVLTGQTHSSLRRGGAGST